MKPNIGGRGKTKQKGKTKMFKIKKVNLHIQEKKKRNTDPSAKRKRGIKAITKLLDVENISKLIKVDKDINNLTANDRMKFLEEAKDMVMMWYTGLKAINESEVKKYAELILDEEEEQTAVNLVEAEQIESIAVARITMMRVKLQELDNFLKNNHIVSENEVNEVNENKNLSAKEIADAINLLNEDIKKENKVLDDVKVYKEKLAAKTNLSKDKSCNKNVDEMDEEEMFIENTEDLDKIANVFIKEQNLEEVINRKEKEEQEKIELRNNNVAKNSVKNSVKNSLNLNEVKNQNMIKINQKKGFNPVKVPVLNESEEEAVNKYVEEYKKLQIFNDLNTDNTNKFRLKNKEAKIMNAALKKNIVNSKINEVSVLNNAMKEKLNQFKAGIDNLNLNPLLDDIQYIFNSDKLQDLANNVGKALQKISGMILALKGISNLFKEVLELKEKFDLNAREIKVGSLRAVEEGNFISAENFDVAKSAVYNLQNLKEFRQFPSPNNWDALASNAKKEYIAKRNEILTERIEVYLAQYLENKIIKNCKFKHRKVVNEEIPMLLNSMLFYEDKFSSGFKLRNYEEICANIEMKDFKQAKWKAKACLMNCSQLNLVNGFIFYKGIKIFNKGRAFFNLDLDGLRDKFDKRNPFSKNMNGKRNNNRKYNNVRNYNNFDNNDNQPNINLNMNNEVASSKKYLIQEAINQNNSQNYNNNSSANIQINKVEDRTQYNMNRNIMPINENSRSKSRNNYNNNNNRNFRGRGGNRVGRSGRGRGRGSGYARKNNYRNNNNEYYNQSPIKTDNVHYEQNVNSNNMISLMNKKRERDNNFPFSDNPPPVKEEANEENLIQSLNLGEKNFL